MKNPMIALAALSAFIAVPLTFAQSGPEHRSHKIERTRKRIEKMEQKFKADGQITPEEQSKLDKAQARLNKRVKRFNRKKQMEGQAAPQETPSGG